MDHSTSTENARPWWADVAHLRDDADGPAVARRSPSPSVVTAPVADDPFLLPERARPRERQPAGRPARPQARTRPSRQGRERVTADWFADEARDAGRRTAPRPEPAVTRRPRATLVDVSPEHVRPRAQQVRRAPGERPTVTITGRPDAALPPQVAAPKTVRGRRTREQASSLVASPDRMILWAVALGLLMIIASIGTASADAAAALTLLP